MNQSSQWNSIGGRGEVLQGTAKVIKKQSQGMIHAHLCNCLIWAHEVEDEEKVKHIHMPITRDEGQKIWYWINQIT